MEIQLVVDDTLEAAAVINDSAETKGASGFREKEPLSFNQNAWNGNSTSRHSIAQELPDE